MAHTEKPSNESTRTSVTESGSGIVVNCTNGVAIDDCLRSIKQQTRTPKTVVIVLRDTHAGNRAAPTDDEWRVIEVPSGDLAEARNAGLGHILQQEEKPLGVAFVEGNDQLAPDFVARCTDVWGAVPTLGSFLSVHPGIVGKVISTR